MVGPAKKGTGTCSPGAAQSQSPFSRGDDKDKKRHKGTEAQRHKVFLSRWAREFLFSQPRAAEES